MHISYRRRVYASREMAFSLGVIATVMFVDQLSKAVAFGAAAQPTRTARNVGFFLGIGAGSQTMLILITLAVLGAFGFVAHRTMASVGGWTLGPMLVIGGAGSNVVDRVRLGGVRDFLVVGHLIINIGDIAVAAGLVLTCVTLGVVACRLRRSGAVVRFDPLRLRIVASGRD